MMVRSNNCSDSLPGTEEVLEFIKKEKEQFGEMIARAQQRGDKYDRNNQNDNSAGNCAFSG